MISLGLNILHCPSNVVAVMTIWKWSLFQTILDGYSLRQFEEGEIGVRKKYICLEEEIKGMLF